VADRLELALYCLNNRVLQDAKAAPAAQPRPASEPAKDKTELSNSQPTAEPPKKLS